MSSIAATLPFSTGKTRSRKATNMREVHRSKMEPAAKPVSGAGRPAPQDLALLNLNVTYHIGGAEQTKKVSLINIPNHGNEQAVLVLREILRDYPSDALMVLSSGHEHGPSIECWLIKSLTGFPPAAAGGPYDTSAAPDPEKKCFRRLRVKMRNSGGDPRGVEVANIPATTLGMQLFRSMIKSHVGQSRVFYTQDFGELLLSDVDVASIEALNGIRG